MLVRIWFADLASALQLLGFNSRSQQPSRDLGQIELLMDSVFADMKKD